MGEHVLIKDSFELRSISKCQNKLLISLRNLEFLANILHWVYGTEVPVKFKMHEPKRAFMLLGGSPSPFYAATRTGT